MRARYKILIGCILISILSLLSLINNHAALQETDRSNATPKSNKKSAVHVISESPSSSSMNYQHIFGLYHFKNVCIIRLDVVDDRKVSAWVRLVYFNSSQVQDCSTQIKGSDLWDYSIERGGMLWIKHYEAKSIDKIHTCYSAADIEAASKEGIDKNELTNITYVKEKTILLTGPNNNPGHQYFDTLWSLLPMIMRYPEYPIAFKRYFVPFDPDCKLWLCDMMHYFLKPYQSSSNGGAVDRDITMLKFGKENRVHCFDNLYIPRLSEMRPGHNRIRTLHLIPLRRFRSTLLEEIESKVESSELPKSLVNPPNLPLKEKKNETKIKKVLMYDHKSSRKRHWMNSQEIHEKLSKISVNGYYFQVVLLSDLGQYPILQQCQFFYEADILLMVHGAQMANTICSRPGTWIIEIECQSSNLWLSSARSYIEVMGFQYRNILRVPDCFTIDIDSTGISIYKPAITTKSSIDLSFNVELENIINIFQNLFKENRQGR